ncbi:amidohydrolase family protein [Tuwongella immobilis]|uniref:Amidohydrolase-related domain-containing protein n=1 Tax=Tuwongella immobilis TaxID=692036 RepID=A0A6C2YRV3_9BACT|nr:amidohydrolase family protein [Tuwongella immobilis]VIP04074.1 amidohydrolase : Metallo-dependent hydrolase OS=Candidatus Nitrosoarchaeum limnia SFB1 GN=Nlim_0884 PE=4 SV=1: Amidohydro_2 [Tuwongella immobilis]VTS05515.1 amidohydrolase : Metallo-dependent hydrolase OS=Candidatus Nitrosoarchaeum limnia SFB1 GN=Nlim_0884 PE=4 SV=1: Amidohydro_2 [Tuwongella immobilis]
MIDMHIHVVPPNLPGTGPLHELLRKPVDEVAAALQAEMTAAGVTKCLAMGSWNTGDHDPLGIERTLEIAQRVPGLSAIGIADPTRTDTDHLRRVETQILTGRVAALKGYLGYLHYAPSHPGYVPYYELAARFRLPFIFHTGDTYSPFAKLKYAHPLGVDEVAVDFREVRFVIAHIGNPWVQDCAEVVYKNMNVWADLSGLLVGDTETLTNPDLAQSRQDVIDRIRLVMRYAERPNRFLYGTDWPLAPMPAYRDFMREAVLPEFHDQVFIENAQLLFFNPRRGG